MVGFSLENILAGSSLECLYLDRPQQITSERNFIDSFLFRAKFKDFVAY